MKEELRECPFCGEQPVLNMVNIYGKSGSSVKYTYECSNCGLLMIEWDKEKLIKTWNTRSLLQSKEAEIEIIKLSQTDAETVALRQKEQIAIMREALTEIKDKR